MPLSWMVALMKLGRLRHSLPVAAIQVELESRLGLPICLVTVTEMTEL